MMFFYRLLILGLPLGTKTAKKCSERKKKSDLFGKSILNACDAHVTSQEYKKGRKIM